MFILNFIISFYYTKSLEKREKNTAKSLHDGWNIAEIYYRRIITEKEYFFYIAKLVETNIHKLIMICDYLLDFIFSEEQRL